MAAALMVTPLIKAPERTTRMMQERTGQTGGRRAAFERGGGKGCRERSQAGELNKCFMNFKGPAVCLPQF